MPFYRCMLPKYSGGGGGGGGEPLPVDPDDYVYYMINNEKVYDNNITYSTVDIVDNEISPYTSISITSSVRTIVGNNLNNLDSVYIGKNITNFGSSAITSNGFNRPVYFADNGHLDSVYGLFRIAGFNQPIIFPNPCTQFTGAFAPMGTNGALFIFNQRVVLLWGKTEFLFKSSIEVRIVIKPSLNTSITNRSTRRNKRFR